MGEQRERLRRRRRRLGVPAGHRRAEPVHRSRHRLEPDSVPRGRRGRPGRHVVGACGSAATTTAARPGAPTSTTPASASCRTSRSGSAHGRIKFPAVSAESLLHHKIADELGVRDGQVRAAVDLLDGGATVPFIARYRKEVHRHAPTTRSCGRSRSGCATCASWRSGAPRSWSRSGRRASWTTSWPRGSPPRTRRRGSRTSTCRSSPSGGRRRRSPGRTGSSRWPSGSSPRRSRTRRPWRRASSPRPCRTSRPRWRVRGRSSPSGWARTRTSSASCASGCGPPGT